MASHDGSDRARSDVDRVTSNRASEWLLLDGDRLVVAAALLAAVFAVLVVLELAGVTGQRRTDPLSNVFGALVTGNLTLITVVLSINQLVLSRELQSVGDLRDRISGIREYREDVERTTDRSTVPIAPGEFLRVLLADTRRLAESLAREAEAVDDDELRGDVDRLVERLAAHADRVIARVRKPDADTFDALAATLSSEYAREIHEARRLRAAGDRLPAAARDALDGLVERLFEVDVARQYFKTLYMQDELAYFSRVLLYVGVPAEVVSVAVLLAFSTGTDPGAVFLPLSVVSPVVVTVGFAPLAVLFAFVLRIATVAQFSSSTTQFRAPPRTD